MAPQLVGMTEEESRHAQRREAAERVKYLTESDDSEVVAKILSMSLEEIELLAANLKEAAAFHHDERRRANELHANIGVLLRSTASRVDPQVDQVSEARTERG